MAKLSGEAQVGVTWGEQEIGVLRYKLKANFDIEYIKCEETVQEKVSSDNEDLTNLDEKEDMAHSEEIT